jgi:hypothetical protein
MMSGTELDSIVKLQTACMRPGTELDHELHKATSWRITCIKINMNFFRLNQQIVLQNQQSFVLQKVLHL